MSSLPFSPHCPRRTPRQSPPPPPVQMSTLIVLFFHLPFFPPIVVPLLFVPCRRQNQVGRGVKANENTDTIGGKAVESDLFGFNVFGNNLFGSDESGKGIGVGRGGSTGGSSDGRVTTFLPFTRGRPDIPSYLARFGRPSIVPGGHQQQQHQHHQYHSQQQQQRQQLQSGVALTYACGPPELLREASRAAGDAGMVFHSEAFEL